MKKKYFKDLDGLRFICFLMVFLFHSFYTENSNILNSDFYTIIKKDIFGNGNLGVNFFFVLSGFLITYLLIEEKTVSGKINIKNFYIRRVLRIWPLFYFCMFFGFVIFPIIKTFFGQVPNETAEPIYYFTFLNNFNLIKNGLPDASILGVLWSIAIEEQFYFVWPLLIHFVPLKKLYIAFLLIIGLSLLFRALNNTDIVHEMHTLSCISDLAIGGFGAWLIYFNLKFKNFIIKLSKPKLYFVYLLFIIVFFFRDELLLQHELLKVFERLFISIIIMLIILEQAFSEKSFYKMSNFKTISKLGLITYGLYCLHFIGILFATNITKILKLNTEFYQVFLIETSIALVTTILISTISFKYFESPFLKLKNKFL